MICSQWPVCQSRGCLLQDQRLAASELLHTCQQILLPFPAARSMLLLKHRMHSQQHTLVHGLLVVIPCYRRQYVSCQHWNAALLLASIDPYFLEITYLCSSGVK